MAQVKSFGNWKVTEYGLECAQPYYDIPYCALNDVGLIDSMADKRWVNLNDFKRALKFALDKDK